jgi:deazaflavin-dependent oxidoreductase (nitroreductase family)
MSMNDYNTPIIEEFRANAGRVGGTWEGRDLLLLTTTGRKSGRPHTTPMVFTRDGDRLLVYASKAGAPTHPDWYLNLVADPHVVVEIGPNRLDAVATPLEGEERDSAFAAQAARNPVFADYAQKTSRVIPVVALTPAPR